MGEFKVKPYPTKPPGGSPKLSDGQVYDARRKYGKGTSKHEIADSYGVSTRTISDAIHGRGAYENV